MPDATQPESETIYRLTDIDTEEVSIVDAAANRRKFLIVKEAGAPMSKAGAQVTSDGKGGHTVVKEPTPPQGAPPAPTPPAAAPAPGTPPADAPTPRPEPVLSLSPEAKAELVKRFVAAEARLAMLKSLVEGATEVAGLVEVPMEIATKVAELLTALAEGEVEKSESGEVVTKGLAQFSSTRTAQLQAAYDALGAVLGGVQKPVPAPVAEENAETVTDDDAVEKVLTKAFAPLEAKLARGLEAIVAVVAQQGAAIEKQAGIVQSIEKSRSTPRSGAPEGELERVGKDDGGEYDDGGAWPTDMSDPDKHDVTKVDTSVRFTVKR